MQRPPLLMGNLRLPQPRAKAALKTAPSLRPIWARLQSVVRRLCAYRHAGGSAHVITSDDPDNWGFTLNGHEGKIVPVGTILKESRAI